jgi:hypothetical protein
MARVGSPLGGQVEHDVPVQLSLQGGIADDERSIGLASSLSVLGVQSIDAPEEDPREDGRSPRGGIEIDDPDLLARHFRDQQHGADLRRGGDSQVRHDAQPRYPLIFDRRINPTSASPEASFSAQAEGTSRDTETPGGGSWRSPQVRGRAFKKSTREIRIIDD